jgi:HAL2 family 3'(2'),5'-bisphosphate nucleotidase
MAPTQTPESVAKSFAPSSLTTNSTIPIMPTETRLIDAAREATLLAAAVCRQVQQQLDAVRAIAKDDRSPVTVADFASQALVAATLAERLGPDLGAAPLVAEENSAYLRLPQSAPYRQALLEAVRAVRPDLDATRVLELIDRGDDGASTTRFWTLDPIDGTLGFLRGQQYAIALALVDRASPTLGVLACPNLPRSHDATLDAADPVGALYVAVKSAGLEEYPCSSELREPPRRIEPPPLSSDAPIRACASVEKAHSHRGDTDRLLQHLGANQRVLRLDSQAKYAVVARGQADAYLRLPTRKDYVERIWDHAAGSLVATEGGCVVSDVHGRQLDFGQGRGLERNRGLVVARAGAHERILRAIAELGIDAGGTT